MRLISTIVFIFSFGAAAITRQEIEDFLRLCNSIKAAVGALGTSAPTDELLEYLETRLARVRILEQSARSSEHEATARALLQRAAGRVEAVRQRALASAQPSAAAVRQGELASAQPSAAAVRQGELASAQPSAAAVRQGELASAQPSAAAVRNWVIANPPPENPEEVVVHQEQQSNAPSQVSVARSWVSQASTRLTRQSAFNMREIAESNLWVRLLDDLAQLTPADGAVLRAALTDVVRYFAGNNESRRRSLETCGQPVENEAALYAWAEARVRAFIDLAARLGRAQAALIEFANQNRRINVMLEYLNQYFESRDSGFAGRTQALFGSIQDNVAVTEAVERANMGSRPVGRQAQRRGREADVSQRTEVRPGNNAAHFPAEFMAFVNAGNWQHLDNQFSTQLILDYYNGADTPAMPQPLRTLLNRNGRQISGRVGAYVSAAPRVVQSVQATAQAALASTRNSGQEVSVTRGQAALSTVLNLRQAQRRHRYPTVAQFGNGPVQVEAIENRGGGHCFYEAVGTTIEQFIVDVGQNLNHPVVQGFFAGVGNVGDAYNAWAANLLQNLGADGEHLQIFRAIYGQLLIMVIQGNQWVPLAGQPAINWQEPVTVVGYTGDGDLGHYVALNQVHTTLQNAIQDGNMEYVAATYEPQQIVNHYNAACQSIPQALCQALLERGIRVIGIVGMLALEYLQQMQNRGSSSGRSR